MKEASVLSLRIQIKQNAHQLITMLLLLLAPNLVKEDPEENENNPDPLRIIHTSDNHLIEIDLIPHENDRYQDAKKLAGSRNR